MVRVTPRKTRWARPGLPTQQDENLAAQCGITRVTAAILRQRGYTTPGAVGAFFTPCPSGLRDPFTLPGMDEAVARLHRAVEGREPILIFGDYDVDGITSAALLTRSLRALGANVTPRIPERHEGYGLHPVAMDEAHAAGIRLVVSADCGITAHTAASHAKSLGLDLIITDHHEPDDTLPDALAVVNPKRADSEYGFRELSGCGVAFKLMQALMTRHWPQHAVSFHEKFVELAGLAAVADCVPLVDENRILARDGLARMAQTRKLGLRELMTVSGMKVNGALSGRQVGFTLAPRLNAAGRMASPRMAFDLLMTSDLPEAMRLARELDELNRDRQDLTKRIFEEAVRLAEDGSDWSTDMLVVVAGVEWPRGVVGLAASRLVELYGRPAIVLGREDDMLHGSGRSIAGFDLHSILDATRDLLVEGGGHQMACGLTMAQSNFAEFRERAQHTAAQSLTHDGLALAVDADCEVAGRDVSMKLAEEFANLEPCGTGNPEPRLMLHGARLLESRSMGREKDHRMWTLDSDGKRFQATWFNPGSKADGLSAGATVDICFVPERNDYRGEVSLRLNLKEARKSV